MIRIILTRYGKRRRGFSFMSWPTSKLPETMEAARWWDWFYNLQRRKRSRRRTYSGDLRISTVLRVASGPSIKSSSSNRQVWTGYFMNWSISEEITVLSSLLGKNLCWTSFSKPTISSGSNLNKLMGKCHHWWSALSERTSMRRCPKERIYPDLWLYLNFLNVFLIFGERWLWNLMRVNHLSFNCYSRISFKKQSFHQVFVHALLPVSPDRLIRVLMVSHGWWLIQLIFFLQCIRMKTCNRMSF